MEYFFARVSPQNLLFTCMYTSVAASIAPIKIDRTYALVFFFCNPYALLLEDNGNEDLIGGTELRKDDIVFVSESGPLSFFPTCSSPYPRHLPIPLRRRDRRHRPDLRGGASHARPRLPCMEGAARPRPLLEQPSPACQILFTVIF